MHAVEPSGTFARTLVATRQSSYCSADEYVAQQEPETPWRYATAASTAMAWDSPSFLARWATSKSKTSVPEGSYGCAADSGAPVSALNMCNACNWVHGGRCSSGTAASGDSAYERHGASCAGAGTGAGALSGDVCSARGPAAAGGAATTGADPMHAAHAHPGKDMFACLYDDALILQRVEQSSGVSQSYWRSTGTAQHSTEHTHHMQHAHSQAQSQGCLASPNSSAYHRCSSPPLPPPPAPQDPDKGVDPDSSTDPAAVEGAASRRKLLGESGACMHAGECAVAELQACSHNSLLTMTQTLWTLGQLTPVRLDIFFCFFCFFVLAEIACFNAVASQFSASAVQGRVCMLIPAVGQLGADTSTRACS